MRRGGSTFTGRGGRRSSTQSSGTSPSDDGGRAIMASTEQGVVLRMTRRFDAPREQVFDAWTNPDVVRRWWSAFPNGDTPTAELDLREGGRYRLAMRDV